MYSANYRGKMGNRTVPKGHAVMQEPPIELLKSMFSPFQSRLYSPSPTIVPYEVDTDTFPICPECLSPVADLKLQPVSLEAHLALDVCTRAKAVVELANNDYWAIYRYRGHTQRLRATLASTYGKYSIHVPEMPAAILYQKLYVDCKLMKAQFIYMPYVYALLLPLLETPRAEDAPLRLIPYEADSFLEGVNKAWRERPPKRTQDHLEQIRLRWQADYYL